MIGIEYSFQKLASVESIKPRIDAVAKMINGLSYTYSAKLEEQTPNKHKNKKAIKRLNK